MNALQKKFILLVSSVNLLVYRNWRGISPYSLSRFRPSCMCALETMTFTTASSLSIYIAHIETDIRKNCHLYGFNFQMMAFSLFLTCLLPVPDNVWDLFRFYKLCCFEESSIPIKHLFKITWSEIRYHHCNECTDDWLILMSHVL